jgi:hypothetical protein
MIRFLALIRDGKAKVIPVAGGELHRVAATEKKAGGIIVGDYSNPDAARRATLLGLQGWRQISNKKAS